MAGPGPWQSTASRPGASAAATRAQAGAAAEPPRRRLGLGGPRRVLTMAHAAGPPRAWRPGCSLSPFQADASLRVTPRRGSGAGPRWPGRSRRRGQWPTGRLGASARTGVPVPAHSPGPPGRPPGSSTVQGARFIRPRLSGNAPNAGVTVMTPESESARSRPRGSLRTAPVARCCRCG